MKKVLCNKVNRKLMREKLLKDTTPRSTLSFYKYHQIEDVQKFRDELFEKWQELGVLGRTYVASEGINAQISVPTENKEKFVEHLFSYPFLNGIRLNWAIDDNGKSFPILKIKIRNKIVADGIEDPNFDPSQTGFYLKAHEFNAITDSEDVVLVDMRNHYESEVGHFQNAICPDVDNFRESLPLITNMLEKDKDKKIIMYCTGGIRCEKASAYFKYKGFKNVYHLEGGIIEYTRQVRNQGLKNKFIGKNFVFDERLGERISDDVIARCHQCGEPCDTHVNCANEACHTLFIQCEKCKEKYNGCCCDECREFIALPLEEQKARRKGKVKNVNFFKKGRDVKEKFFS